MAALLVETIWFEATRLVALHYRIEVKAIRAPGTRGGRPPKATWQARKLAVHLTVEACDEAPATVGRLLQRFKRGVYVAIGDIARDRAEDPVFDAEVTALELRLRRWRARHELTLTPVIGGRNVAADFRAPVA